MLVSAKPNVMILENLIKCESRRETENKKKVILVSIVR